MTNLLARADRIHALPCIAIVGSLLIFIDCARSVSYFRMNQSGANCNQSARVTESRGAFNKPVHHRPGLLQDNQVTGQKLA
jgi:hypothetical protein